MQFAYFVFDKNYFRQFILLFNLILLLFMSLIAFFDTIYESHCIMSINFYLYLQYFQQKVFSENAKGFTWLSEKGNLKKNANLCMINFYTKILYSK